MQDCEDCDEPKKGLIDKITSNVHIEGDFDEAQRKRLAQIAERCPVHKTLANGVVFEDNATFA
jgi:putative redox protein